MQADDLNKDNGKKVKDKAKKVLKATLKIFTKKLVIIAVVLFLVIIALGGAYDALMDAFSDKVSKYTAEHPVQVQYDADDNSIVISDEQADELIEELEKMGFKLNSLHLSKDLIKKCYAAEVVSQELNRGAEEQEGKYYGRVYVKKASSTNSSTDEAIPLTYVPYEEMTGGKTETGTTTSSLNDFLFIGDSRTEGMRANLEALGNNVKVFGVVSSSPSNWVSVTQNGSGNVMGTRITLPDSAAGISVALGVNNTAQVEGMKTVLNNLLNRYPNKPIYVNSVFYVGSGYSYPGLTAAQMNANIDEYNNMIKDYCGTNTNLIYVDISSGLHESNYLKSSYTSDNLHLNTNGNTKLAQNIKDAILNTSGTSTIGETLSDGKNITECFSVSPEGKLVIANKVVNTDNNGNKTTSISLKELEYKSKITKYITPFEFLINLCVATQNPEYISALTDKIVKETSIVITIMDNATPINTTRTYKYKNATSVDKEGRIYVKNSETGEYTDSGRRNPTRGNPQVTLPSQESDYISDTPSNSSIEIHNPTIQITEVDTWFVKQKITYNNQTNGPTEDTSYEEIEDETPSHTDASYRYQYTTEDTSGTAEEVRMYISTITYKVNQMIEVITNTTINTYSEGVSETDEGSDAQGKTDEILEMLKTKYKLPLSMIKEAPIHKLVNRAGIFFQMLEKSSRTQELEKIMKYVLYLYNGKDYGVTELDYSIFNIDKFSIIGTIYGSTTEDKFWYALKNLGYSDESICGAMGNIRHESDFNPTALNSSSGAYGLAQWLGGRLTSLKAYAASKGVSEDDDITQIEFLVAELTGQGNAKDYATRRKSGGNGELHHTYEEWAAATTVEDAAVFYCWFFETPSTSPVETDETRDIEKKRIKYAKEYYQIYKGRGTGGEFVANQGGEYGVKGYYTSSTGRVFTILNQTVITNWHDKCNRAACAIIASGYSDKSSSELIEDINNKYDGPIPSNEAYWNYYGLEITLYEHPGKDYQTKLQQQIASGGYALLWLNNNKSDYYGKSGTKWTSLYHWVAVIDHKYENNIFKICIADWRGITWVDIDEFSTYGVTNMVFVNEK